MSLSLPPTLTVETLREALSGPLPGRRAQLWMAPQPRPLTADHRAKPAAVLILLYPCGTDWCFPLTLRGDALTNHQGQVSLPGGAREEDEPLAQTALRETAEELGIRLQEAEVLGKLTPLYIPPSDFEVTPFVAYLPRRPEFRPNPSEVAEVVDTPVSVLVDEDTRKEEDWHLPDGRHLRVPFFHIQGHKVWGATAIILGEFVWMLRQTMPRHG